MPVMTVNAGYDSECWRWRSEGGGSNIKGAATLRGQQHREVTSPSYCQPRLNVESQRFDQGTALSCGVSLRGSRLSKRWVQNK
jgi:hypothetical protein